MPPEVGLSATYEFVVAQQLSTDVGGSVRQAARATRQMIAVMERTAILAVEVTEGGRTIGTGIHERRLVESETFAARSA